ncbi:3-keto-disaccharide hydrolase [Thalassotalea litorea]|uniref:3-keto-disaccharide hydrolase n=1 Tax=Thalassotalea litorea TaxID=2020715 RepID=UPI0037367458
MLAMNMAILCASCATVNKASLLDPQLSQFENVYPFGNATMVDGELHLQSESNWFLTTRKTYQDFILTAEIKMPDVTEYSNSGFIFRGQIRDLDQGKVVVGYQAEVDPSPRRWSGGLFDQGRRQWLHPEHPVRSNRDKDFIKSYIANWNEELASTFKANAWNHYRIECRGTEIKITVNGILTTHIIDRKDSKGVIGLQHHGSKQLRETGKSDNIVRFRNIYIVEL